MFSQVGRTGFHVTHTKAVGERGAILDEMMRELNEESIARWAARNPNIVVEDEHLNIALVNDGEGDLVPCEDPKEVIAYGGQRLAKLSTPVKEPKRDPATGKETGGTWTSSMFALHLPKNLCREVKDFYPVLDDEGNEVGRRSRWVARDHDEALRYFEDAVEYLAQEVIPGGWDAILGADVQFSESTPHIQLLADVFAPDPKRPGQLRTEFSRAYGSHRDVRDDKGRQMSGQAKFRRYHDGLKEWMIERGWEIEREVDPLRHETGHSKAVYAEMQDAERTLRQRHRDFDNDIGKRRGELNEMREEIAAEREALERDEIKVNLARKEVETEGKTARSEGYADGLQEGRAQGIAEAERLQRVAREQLALAEELYNKALTAPSISDEQARGFATLGAGYLAKHLGPHVDDATQKKVERVKAGVERMFARSSEMLAEQVREVERVHGNRLVRDRSRVMEVSETLTAAERHLGPYRRPDGQPSAAERWGLLDDEQATKQDDGLSL